MFGLKLFSSIFAFFTATAMFAHPAAHGKAVNLLSSHEMPLNDRYSVPSVNDVFKDNILLTLGYMRGIVDPKQGIQWNEVRKPFHYDFTLNPQENFAFHDTVLKQYEGKIAKSTHATFNYQQGFESDGYLYGDGVCHMASLLYWVAKDGGLEALAPVGHDFAIIPDVPRIYGAAIYYSPNDYSSSAEQNVYITNNKAKPVKFAFDYKDNKLTVSASEETINP